MACGGLTKYICKIRVFSQKGVQVLQKTFLPAYIKTINPLSDPNPTFYNCKLTFGLTCICLGNFMLNFKLSKSVNSCTCQKEVIAQ